ncbi:hypothetical protein ACJMK2_023452 [Sinanodonta woodiana]|uniref:Pyridoxal phosphate phosphatase PHOSPHO2 n=1 Tax=Sinanodonta woodiana TaxID=1069815 RepID=A0ABD3T5X8_SINWO
MSGPILVAFDFDHTIIDENSDLSVIKLAPDGELPEEIQAKYSDNGWTNYMGAIFEYLHKNGTTKDDFAKCINDIPFTSGFAELFQYLRDDCFEVIIISDSNMKFIELFLENAEISNIVYAVYTNPAHFDNSGCLRIQYYHEQDWCDLSTVNLCKGHILQEHIKQRDRDGIRFRHVVYVGDGYNDLCPALTMKQHDYICPRKDFKLWREMKRLGILDGEASELDLKAKIVEWDSGIQILDLLKTLQK